MIGRMLLWLAGFGSGALVVTGLTLQVYWGTWGKQGGAGLTVFGGVASSIASLLLMHFDD